MVKLSHNLAAKVGSLHPATIKLVFASPLPTVSCVPEINVPSGALLHVFPNPWNGSDALQLIYSAGNEDRIEIRLLDMSGRLVWSEGRQINPSVFNQIEISPELSKGCYLLEIRGADAVYSSRLIRF